MRWRRKRAGQTLSKGRVLGAQFEGLLADDHWLDLARHANARAKRLADSVSQGSEARLAWPCQANEVFLVLPPAVQERLKAAGIGYYDWSARSLPPDAPLKAGEIVGRFVMSFATEAEEVENVITAIAG
jgi:threonine aldolase